MAELTTCPDCGAALPVDAPEGFCPRCLMRAGAFPASGAEGLSNPGLTEGLLVLPEDLAGGSAPRTVFGNYELLKEVARGGMGVVYKARQRSLNRIVAVKMILAGQFATKEFVRRFRAEAATAAMLEHPNIVAIHEVGIHDGRHFFSMDYVEGQNLAQLVGHRPLPVRQAARYLKQIAEAIHYAHGQGVLHRDLKPSNVLMDSATDQPRITDFGLARRLDGESSLTLTGQVLGSPNFMPPEQTGEGHGKVGRHSDVYGLGAILYYLLTARPPFRGETLGATVAQVVNLEPTPPRVLNPAVTPDLETICLKCLEKEPSRRYQTARELAQELDRFLSNEPIVARPVSTLERAWRWCQRRPGLATLGGIALALLFVIVVGAPIALVRIQRARITTERNLYIADMKLASEAVKAGAYNNLRELLDRHRPAQGQGDLRGFEWRYFWKVLQNHRAERTWTGLPSPGWEDASLLISGNILYNQSRGELLAWDLNTWEALPLIKPIQPSWVKWVWNPAKDRAYALDATNCSLTAYRLPDFRDGQVVHLPGPAIAAATSRSADLLTIVVDVKGEHRILVWNLAQGVQKAEWECSGEGVSKIEFSPDKNRVAALFMDGTIGLWDVASAEPLPTPVISAPFRFWDFAFFPDGKRLLLQALPESCRVWDIGAGKELPFGAGDKLLNFYGFSPSGDRVLASADGEELYLLDTMTLQLVGTLRGHQGSILNCKYSRDGRFLATASIDQTARIWDLASDRELAILGGFGERISDIVFVGNDQKVIVINGSGVLKQYDWPKIANSSLFATTPTTEGVVGVAISPDQRTLATRAVMGTVTLWDLANRNPVFSLPLNDRTWGNLAFAPNGKSLAWVSSKALRVLLLDSRRVSTLPVDGCADRGDVAFSPDGDELAYACRTQLEVLELNSNQSHLFAPSDDQVVGVGYSPDGKSLAFGDRLGSVYLCDRHTGQILDKKLKVHPPHVYGMAFSPDGRFLATCSDGSTLKLWEVSTHKLRLKADLHGHVGYIGGLTFSPDGARLVTGSGDHTLKLWDVQQGVEVATLYGHNGLIGPPAFTRDGNTIYSCGFDPDRQIRLWEAAPLVQVESNNQPNLKSQ